MTTGGLALVQSLVMGGVAIWIGWLLYDGWTTDAVWVRG